MREPSEKNQEEKRKTILVVDDDEQLLCMLCEVVRTLGYTVVGAKDGESGWDEYKKTEPDLAVLDIRMPRGDGLTLLSRIRQNDPSTPVIMITGFSFDKQIDAFKRGADDFLRKPFRIEYIERGIKDLLGCNNLELEARRWRRLAFLLTEQVERLEKKTEQLTLKINKILVDALSYIFRIWGGKKARKGVDKYRAICGSVAHSLKGEFMHIGCSIEELRRLGSASPDTQEECDIIERSVAYSEVVLRRLLDYLDMGTPQVERVSPLEVLRKAELLARPRLPSTLQLEITVDDSMKKRTVSANIEQLVGVLLELIQNAVNVLREKGGTIELKLEDEDGKIAISVKDNGPGIPKELRKKLFKRQVTSKSSLGLGLFLCDKVVSEFGGKLSLKSSSKEGTTFTVLLPTTSHEKEP